MKRSIKAAVANPGRFSAAVIALNPQLGAKPSNQAIAAPQTTATGLAKAGGHAKPRARKPMNKTEQAYADRLEAMRRRGDIVSWEREGITLRWPDGMTYTPDFSIVLAVGDREMATGTAPAVSWLLVECKGPWIEEDAKVKFRAARDKWGHLYRFEMWQRQDRHSDFSRIL